MGIADTVLFATVSALAAFGMVAGQNGTIDSVSERCPAEPVLSQLCPIFPNPIPECPDLCPPYSHNCSAYPTAHCITKWCSSCSVRWYVLAKSTETAGWFQVGCNVTDTPRFPLLPPKPGCPLVTSCPVNQAYFRCFREPCDCQTCPKIPSAVCCNDFCNRCGYAFYLNGVDVTSSC